MFLRAEQVAGWLRVFLAILRETSHHVLVIPISGQPPRDPQAKWALKFQLVLLGDLIVRSLRILILAIHSSHGSRQSCNAANPLSETE